MQDFNFKKIFFIILLLSCLTPYINAPIALLMGFLFTYFLGNPFSKLNSKLTGLLLKISIVGLGFGINVNQALHVGKQGFWLTLSTIVIVLVAGYLIGKLLKVEKKSSYLISSGTAICGGSAIAAVSPIIQASEESISASLGVIFILNSIALFIFPPIAHLIGLTQSQFGLWSAVAIHDTSSVVGAASSFGNEALHVATTVKLARTLWIIPLSFLSVFLFKPENKKINIPWFIGFFIMAMLIHSYFNFFPTIEQYVVGTSRSLLVATLFLIGASLSISKIKKVGWRFLSLGVSLWVIISLFSLFIITTLY